MGGAVNEEQVFVWPIGTGSLTVNYSLKRWTGSTWATVDSGTLNEDSGIYYKAFTPTQAGPYRMVADYTYDSTTVRFGMLYFIGMGQEDDIETLLGNGTYGLAALDAELEDIRQKATSPSWNQDTDSLEAISDAISGISAGTGHGVDDTTIYIVAEDMGTIEIVDDGYDPALTSEVTRTNANETAGEGNPSWSEDIDFEQTGTLYVISIFYSLEWQMKLTGSGTAYAKWQVSGDGGSTWVDVTDNVTETGTSYIDKERKGVGRHITTITSGANKLQFRLCAWTSATSVETKVRSSSYVQITFRKA